MATETGKREREEMGGKLIRSENAQKRTRKITKDWEENRK